MSSTTEQLAHKYDDQISLDFRAEEKKKHQHCQKIPISIPISNDLDLTNPPYWEYAMSTDLKNDHFYQIFLFSTKKLAFN